ncbi:MAG: NAD(P)/FAD-dependent oxidoreductase [Ardenticatenales bacterium]|nr:NAD(P)/FAD-dependent oxidoreductase [Ardenticatenales bacterium]
MTTDGQDDIYDVTILGAGPTGLFGVFYAGMREMKTKIIEALPEMGGQLTVLYPEKFIFDVAGFPKVLAKDLVQRLVQQAEQWDPQICLDERVVGLEYVREASEGVPPIIKLTSDKGQTHLTHTLVITAGIGAFSPNKLDRPGVAQYEEKGGVAYFVKKKADFRGKRLLIVGGGDSAVDWGLNLKDWTHDITLIHRRHEFRAHESSVVELRNSPVQIMTPWELLEVHGDGEHVTGATIKNNETEEQRTIPADVVLLNLGFKASLGAIADWGLKSSRRHIFVDGFCQTNLPGVYAAGDVAQPNEGPQMGLIAVGFAQATIAVNVAKSFIDPKSKIFPGHSSEMKI